MTNIFKSTTKKENVEYRMKTKFFMDGFLWMKTKFFMDYLRKFETG